MTPQSGFMVLAEVDPARERELRDMLESMNEGPGRVDPHNPFIPFAEFAELHMARLLLLDDSTSEDIHAHGAPSRRNPLYLAFLGDVDGSEDAFLRALASRAPGLHSLFACCRGFQRNQDLLAWMRSHRNPWVAGYVNTRGRTVRQVREEACLAQAIDCHLAHDGAGLRGRPAREVHSALRAFVAAENAAGRLTLSPPRATPLAWRLRETLHLVGMPLVALLLFPFLLVAAPFYVVWLRLAETSDPEIGYAAEQAHGEALAALEDHDVSNPFSAMGSLKPGMLRLLTIRSVLAVVDYAARHLVRDGRLGRIRTIHFARWTFIGGTQRMAFFSNYDGSVERYMDDFINKVGFGLNASFSNGVGYPRTRWLVLDGCRDERAYKEFLRRHTLATTVWYKAYPGLTAVDLERHTLLRRGLEDDAPDDASLRAWAGLL